MGHSRQSVEQLANGVSPDDLHNLGWQSFTHEHGQIAIAARVYANHNLALEERQAFFQGLVFAHFIETIPIRQDELTDEAYGYLDAAEEPPATQN
jgi:hypothetical protein